MKVYLLQKKPSELTPWKHLPQPACTRSLSDTLLLMMRLTMASIALVGVSVQPPLKIKGRLKAPSAWLTIKGGPLPSDGSGARRLSHLGRPLLLLPQEPRQNHQAIDPVRVGRRVS
jgi:hypothetical protein